MSDLSTYPAEHESFRFLDGNWRILNRRLKAPLADCDEWIEFQTQASFATLLDGLVSVEEMRDAEGKPFGGAMRTFDRAKRTWSDAWVSARDGVLNPPSHGRFDSGGVGIWQAPDEHQGRPILYRGLWRRVSADVAEWEQAFSADGGASWETNWHMRFERVAGPTASPLS